MASPEPSLPATPMLKLKAQTDDASMSPMPINVNTMSVEMSASPEMARRSVDAVADRPLQPGLPALHELPASASRRVEIRFQREAKVNNRSRSHLQSSPKGAKVRGNHVTTAKYNLLSFLPKSLFEQYRRAANLYFTLVAVLSFFSFSPVGPVVCVTPLVFVLAVAITKEAWEDAKRRQQDRAVNRLLVECWDGSALVEKMWQQVEVGDVVVVRKNQQLPADLALLNTSLPDGVCYVETMNLDGETNLKIKKAVEETNFITPADLGPFEGTIECDPPNSSLYTFTGTLALKPAPPAAPPKLVPLNPEQILLRGSSLRNTDWAVGAVVYAGIDTKVFMNSTNAPSKRSRVDYQLDRVVYIMFAKLVAMCLVSCIAAALWTKQNGEDMWYVMLKAEPHAEFDPRRPLLVAGYSFLNGLILYGYLIPISLYISVEIAKVIQALYFINFDQAMYHAPTDTWAMARTSNLNEELGMVQIVMSDKTGTLTRNTMEFFRCSIAGESYGQGVTEVEVAVAKRKGLPEPRDTESERLMPPGGFEKGFNMVDQRLLNGAWARQPQRSTIEKFFQLLAVCHTVVPEGDPGNLTYQAQSPDELAFVVAAKTLGFTLTQRTPTHVYVSQEGPDSSQQELSYEILAILEFNSTRKRMSVVCRGTHDKKLILFCKGADNVILPRLRDDCQWVEKTEADLLTYSQSGLRTLCLAYAELDDATFSTWHKRYFQAKLSLVDREEKVMAVAEQIEKELILLGATAIEDKLQEDVPATISQLATAGIALWMLTGDKMETAINIGYACCLLINESVQHVISIDTDEIEQKRDQNLSPEELDAVVKQLVLVQMKTALKEIEENESRHNCTHNALIIDGRALTVVLTDRVKGTFLELGMRCQSVICCRVSPLQKAQVTLMVKGAGMLVLSIGDGANDVGMIQAANIGIGISGQEGMQATMASDYAIGQFRFLSRLLLVHGRWNYKRIALVMCYFFYKNVVFGMSLLFYNWYAFNTGQMVYQELFASSYNVCFTFLPVIAVAVFDQDVSADMGLRYSQVYTVGSSNSYFTFWELSKWYLKALYHSVVLTFGVLGWYGTTVLSNGKVTEMDADGMVLYTVIVLTVNLELANVLTYWNWVTAASVALSFAAWFCFIGLYGRASPDWALGMYYVFEEVLAPEWSFWLLCLLLVAACLLPEAALSFYTRMVKPTDSEILQEMESQQGGNKTPSKLEDGQHSRQPQYRKSVTRVNEPASPLSPSRALSIAAISEEKLRRGSTISSPVQRGLDSIMMLRFNQQTSPTRGREGLRRDSGSFSMVTDTLNAVRSLSKSVSRTKRLDSQNINCSGDGGAPSQVKVKLAWGEETET